MPASKVRVVLDRAMINSMLTEYAGATAKKGADSCRERVRSAITSAGRVDTGAMRSNISIRPTKSTGTVQSYSVSANAPYASFQNDGTRAHGPVSAQFLVFKPKGSNTMVFAKKVRGVTAARFMEKALAGMTLADFL